MTVEAKELAERLLEHPTASLRTPLLAAMAYQTLLAEAVEMLCLSGTVPVPRIEAWLRRVAAATEGGEDGRPPA